MHPVLTESLDRLKAHFSQEERCLGIYLWGSLGNQTADGFSDVDVAVVVRSEDYAAVKAELRSVCETHCGPILVWMAEGESADFVNYAFLFESGEDLLLYDVALLTDARLAKNPPLHPRQILFDKTNSFPTSVQPPTSFLPDMQGLSAILLNYWVYTYLNGKYYGRKDIYKLLYVQQTLFQSHLNLLRWLHLGKEWNWWARDVHHLPEAKQQELLVYFGASTPEEVASALEKEMTLFSQDAQTACQQWGVEYPHALEQGVREHLRRMQVTK